MIGLLTGLSLRTWLIIAAVGAVLAAAGAIYAKGRSDATSATTIEQQSKTIETLRDRSKTDAEINSADDARLCSALGGVYDAAIGKCL
jgi:hypothetical protein